MSNPSNHRSQLNPYVCLLLNVRRFADEFLSIASAERTFNPLRQQTRKFSTELKASRILLANVLQKFY